MSKIEVDAIEPQSGTSLTVGASGDTITIPSGATFDSSAATNTLASNVVTTDGTQTLTNKSIVASQLTGTVATSNLGTGTADATTFLRGDNTFATAGLTGVTTDSGNVTITDGDLIFGGAGHGVYLGVTSATAANHLDDYEEGSFTPAYAFDSGSVAMQSGSRGDYVKVGNLVHFQIYMATDSISSPSGDATISGLPFTTGDNSSSSAVIGLLYRFGTDFDGELKVRVGQDSTVLSPFKNASNATSATRFQGSDFTSGTAYNNLHVAGCYSTA